MVEVVMIMTGVIVMVIHDDVDDVVMCCLL